MTKFIKRFSFWTKIRMLLGLLGIGGEITLYISESIPQWHIVAGIATLISVIITYFFTDSNNNDVVDILEKNE